MDITQNPSTSKSWDLDMGNHLLQYQTHLEFFHPTEPLQPHDRPLLKGEQEEEEEKEGKGEDEALDAMKEMMYKIAAMQPVEIDPATIKKPKRRNVRISDEPQSIAARHRRERISERIRILQRLVPGGTKMDTASMLDEAIRYVKFLKRQVQELQNEPAAAAVEWGGARQDGSLSSSASSSAARAGTGLGFGFSSDGSCSHMR